LDILNMLRTVCCVGWCLCLAEKWHTCCCNWTGVQQMVSECVDVWGWIYGLRNQKWKKK